MISTRWVVLLVLALVTVTVAEEYDVDNEIAKVKHDLEKVASERQKNRDAALQDKKEFDAYESRTRARLKALASETDSVRAAVAGYSKKSDSLGALLGGIKGRAREYEMRQHRLREDLISLCNKQIELSGKLLPSLAQETIARLTFLKSELDSKTADNAEGLNRLIQILGDIESQYMDIQITQGISPVPDIHGTAYRLRIGGIFEAVVSGEGDKASIWHGDEGWQTVDDPAVAEGILKAVLVREGRSLPSLVELPIGREPGGAK